ncbi:MAG: PKD domain-containing protein [Bacteroidetes bacterium]|nr:PKD domain-containing protein [Bacteroidota bacterium]
MRTNLILFLMIFLGSIGMETRASHIIGGEIKYRCLGGNNYEITLELYRDCFYGLVQLPNPATISVYYDDDTEIPASSYSFARVSYDTLDLGQYQNQCFIPPIDICVQKAVYIDTINLPQVSGGYQVVFESCCRNASIDNIDQPADNWGASYYIVIPDTIIQYPAMPVIWWEDFDLPDATTSDAGPTAWTRNITGGTFTGGDHFDVRNQLFEGNDPDATVKWYSEWIDISAYPGGITASIDVSGTANMEDSDSLRIYYQINAGAPVLFPGGNIWNDPPTATLIQYNLTGDSIRIIVRQVNNATSEYHRFDNVKISEYAPIDTVLAWCNNSPSFDTFPPVFICLGDSLILDQSATDADGDSLVYSLATPYDDYGATLPPPLIPWEPGYSESNQINGTLTIDSQTGELIVFPSASGQYLICLSVKEYRDGLLLSENKRDFQFNVVVCATDPLPAVPSSNYTCGGSMPVSFQNDSGATAPMFWDFGVTGITTDTSSLPTPSYTYASYGTYTVTLITNPGLICADTGTIILYVTTLDSCCQFSCDPTVTDTNVDLSSKSDTIWLMTNHNIVRNEHCCSASGSDACFRFNILLNSQTEEVSFDVQNPAPPQGSAFYQINCGPQITLGESFCAAGQTTICLTYCKPGGDKPDYIISAGRNSSVSNDLTLRPLCTDTLRVDGLLESTINWTSVYPAPNGTYNSYLSCISQCDTTIIFAPASPPDSVAFQVSGTAVGCASGTTYDTIWVRFTTALTAAIDPDSPAICFGQIGVGLTANGSGGKLPYIYDWNTGEATQTIVAGGAGWYWVDIYDNSDCEPVRDSVEVVVFASPVDANAGPDQIVCTTSPTATLAGTIVAADGGKWSSMSGSPGVFAPDDDTLDADYTPSVAEVIAGSVTLRLISTGNRGCDPDTDYMTITISPLATASAGVDAAICAGNTYTLSGSFGGSASSITWTKSGDGSFNNAALPAATYTPGATDITMGTVTLTITTDDPAGPCTAASDPMILTINTAATASAGADAPICSGSTYTLSGTRGGSATSSTWGTSGTGTFNDNTLLAPIYTPSPADIATGSVILTITTNDPAGPCPAVSDPMTLTINPAATAFGKHLHLIREQGGRRDKFDLGNIGNRDLQRQYLAGCCIYAITGRHCIRKRDLNHNDQ